MIKMAGFALDLIALVPVFDDIFYRLIGSEYTGGKSVGYECSAFRNEVYGGAVFST